MRVGSDQGGMGLGLFDAVLVMEEVGRTLASGPIAEAIVAARLIADLGGEAFGAWLEKIGDGSAVVTIALHDAETEETQWIAGGAVADAVLVLSGNNVVLVTLAAEDRKSEPNFASLPTAEIYLGGKAKRQTVASGAAGPRRLSLQVSKNGNCLPPRHFQVCRARAFASPLNMHASASPSASRSAHFRGCRTRSRICSWKPMPARFMTWKAILAASKNDKDAAGLISLAFWWTARTAGKATAKSLHVFGGYGLSTEYDIHLYTLRAKAWPLIWGDPNKALAEAGRRLYAKEQSPLPPTGEITIEFEFGEAAEALGAELRAFFEKTLTPELKAKAHFSFDGHDAGVHKKLAEAGLLFTSWPKRLGGRATNPYEQYVALREWERAGWTAHAMGTTSMIGQLHRQVRNRSRQSGHPRRHCRR